MAKLTSKVMTLVNSAKRGVTYYFITPALAVGASYMKADVKKSSYDTQTISLNAKFRF